MNDIDVKLSPNDILDKNFNIDATGYRPQEVDEYLDRIIEDYKSFIKYTRKLNSENRELQDENNFLKNELRKLKMEVETIKETNDTGKFTSTNVDILKRLSNLEKIVYGKNE